MNGYANGLLEIDLSSNTIELRKITKEIKKQYISGAGLTTKILWDELPKGADPLGPDNILCFAAGLLVGTNIPTACRVEASAKSPLTGRLGTSNSGNYWGSELKYAGYDGIIIKGAAESLVYLYISDYHVKILSAEHLRGLDAWETIHQIRLTHRDQEIQVATIGQAGENLCRFASIQNGPFDAWGRSGLGAVMGSKKLKAIAVKGNKSISVFNKKEFTKISQETRNAIYSSPFYGPFRKYGTMLATVPYHEFGALPVRNFQKGYASNWIETRSRKQVDNYSTRGVSCMSCPIACAHWVEIPHGPYEGLRMKDLEVTPFVGFAAGCDIEKVDSVIKLTEMCQRYGMDLVSAAAVIAYAMELFQRNILTEEILGFQLAWGDEKATLKLLERIAHREGIGDVLAEGTYRASKKIPNSEQYSIHVKGMEIPMIDPRGRWSTWTFGNLTNIRGGDHLRCRNPVENLKYNENPTPYMTEKFGFSDEIYEQLDMTEEMRNTIFDQDTKDVNIPFMSKWAEDLISVYNILGMCIRPPVLQTVGPTKLAAMINSLTGQNILPEELLKVGERTWNLQKLFNVREGEIHQESKFPERFYCEKLIDQSGKVRGLEREAVEKTLSEYYRARGWHVDTGVPMREKLAQLGLLTKETYT
ncbi:MAG: Aldehyde ferredoxin oxidoreductase [Anaerosolibacter sp.]|jgi:aldehyde:ferredoxin oxidoreductase|uniref:aldehyde ferredoxin oxidoreductase family protein n=1 Tax=Anaerosolibacter sp. TaxID=1872527 RepID=UPI0026063CA0|nr:aldehyde ferredoxin oxidoreductase family protein [Anaerosolibacter sp.]MDF2545338.1 Aldehyde ferredoxin oxidoreductase [Anaerosolibacter sp.]